MGRMKRLRKRLAWAGEPNAREQALEFQIRAIEKKYKGQPAEDMPEPILAEYRRLQCELLIESQRRSGITLIDIRRNKANDGAVYDASPLFRIAKNVAMLMEAGMEYSIAVARAIEDERYHQSN